MSTNEILILSNVFCILLGMCIGALIEHKED